RVGNCSSTAPSSIGTSPKRRATRKDADDGPTTQTAIERRTCRYGASQRRTAQALRVRATVLGHVWASVALLVQGEGWYASSLSDRQIRRAFDRHQGRRPRRSRSPAPIDPCWWLPARADDRRA